MVMIFMPKADTLKWSDDGSGKATSDPVKHRASAPPDSPIEADRKSAEHVRDEINGAMGAGAAIVKRDGDEFRVIVGDKDAFETAFPNVMVPIVRGGQIP